MQQTTTKITLQIAACCAALALLASCGSLPNGGSGSAMTQLKPAVGASLQRCGELVGSFQFNQTRIETAVPIAAAMSYMANQPLPAHCEVKGKMHERKGSDGRDYAIAFEMRLPQAWNGRFYYQANGGLDGSVQPALGALGGGPLTGALMQGFAVISSDAGHTGAQTPYFGLEPQARLDYGYQAVGKLTPMAKAMIASAYGKQPDRSYIGGCSNGGRHAMVAAARYSHQFDGYLIGAPGYRLPNSALAQIWGAQQWAKLATPGATVKHPMIPNATLADLASALTAQERQTVANAILDKCDALDGVRDGMVQATQQCQSTFNLQRDVPNCSTQRTGNCLSYEQKTVLASVMQGGATRDGSANLYSSFVYDPGIAGSNWATWKFINSLALDPLALGTVFSVPPGRVDPLTDDIDARLALMQAKNSTYIESGMQLMTPPWELMGVVPRLDARGGKILMYHGVSDPIFSAEDTRRLVDNFNDAYNGKAADHLRYFPIPGMNHCSGGPATDQFDALAPLVQWVERGIAPQSITASVRGTGVFGGANPGGINLELPKDWADNRTRPLCAYPTVAKFQGTGSTENANNFKCQQP
jgi:pimeloyl-ACP methyl ester carboxylesterase